MYIQTQNTNAGTSSKSGLLFTSDTGAGQLATVSSTFTADASINANETYLYGQNGILNYAGGVNPIRFLTGGSERMRINAGAPILCLSGGNTSATGTGIAFPATQSASSDANTLDDYEEGTWTPTITSGSGTITTSTFSNATYTKIGRLIHLTATITLTTVGTAGGNLIVTGVPFTFSGGQSSGFVREVTLGSNFQSFWQSSSQINVQSLTGGNPTWTNGYAYNINMVYYV